MSVHHDDVDDVVVCIIIWFDIIREHEDVLDMHSMNISVYQSRMLSEQT